MYELWAVTFFVGIIEHFSLRHATSATACASGEQQQFVMVNCDILLTAPSFSQC